jgi:hypothetical protein
MTVICAGLVLFTTSAISSEKSSDEVITSEEMQKINLSHSYKGSNTLKIDEQNTLKKIPSMLETAPMVPELKMYKQSLAQINKVKEKNQFNLNSTLHLRGEVHGNANRDCSDCEFDWTNYGSECCDSAWDEYGIDCATLEGTYNWDCSGCACPGDAPGECGDGACNSNEDCESCPADCGECGTCPDGQILDCDGGNECWPESWIGDGFEDCEDQAYGCDLTCYDNDGGDCGETTSCEDQGLIECMDGSCAETAEDCAACPAGTIADCSGDGDCGFDTWIGDGYCDGSAQQFGNDNCCYDNDGGEFTD